MNSFSKVARRIVSIALMALLVFELSACRTDKLLRLKPSEVALHNEVIVGVTTTSAKDIRFDKGRPARIRDLPSLAIVGWVSNKEVEVPLDQVQRVWVMRNEISTVRTVGLVAGVAVGVTAIVILTGVGKAQAPSTGTTARCAPPCASCPFVYSWDGENYSFDAEPYAGAIAKGLERDDYSELEHLRADHGVYRLQLTNEVDETQFTNLMELWVVDAPRNARIVADEFGRLHALTHSQPPVAATDRAGMDLLEWLRAKDRLIWEPDAVPASDGGLRDEIILTFPKPEAARTAHLVVNGGTGLWGAYMVKTIVELKGREAPAWLESLKPDSDELNALHNWLAHEDVYRLNVDLEEPDGWHTRGSVPPGGPFMAQDRVISIDTSRVRGDKLRVRLRPPKGFWALNSFAISYDDDPEPAVMRVRPVYAKTDDGRDILTELLSEDDQYYAMPSTSNRAEIRFRAPTEKAGLMRTVFLHSRGWYQLHLNTSKEPDMRALDDIFNHSDGAARFAAREYAALKASQN